MEPSHPGPPTYVGPRWARIGGNLLLEQDGAETSIEGTDTLRLEHLAEATDQTAGIGGLRDETDTGSLERAESNVGEELGSGGGGQVDTSAVVGGVLVADQVDGLLLEELVSSELEGTLQEVTGGGWAETGQQSAGTLILDDLLEATNETTVVGNGVELDTGLDAAHCELLAIWMRLECAADRLGVAADEELSGRLGSLKDGERIDVHIDGGQGTVCYGAADGTSEGKSGVEGDTAKLARSGGSGLLDDGIDLGRAGRLRWRAHCDGCGGIKKASTRTTEEELSGVGTWRARLRLSLVRSGGGGGGGWWWEAECGEQQQKFTKQPRSRWRKWLARLVALAGLMTEFLRDGTGWTGLTGVSRAQWRSVLSFSGLSPYQEAWNGGMPGAGAGADVLSRSQVPGGMNPPPIANRQSRRLGREVLVYTGGAYRPWTTLSSLVF